MTRRADEDSSRKRKIAQHAGTYLPPYLILVNSRVNKTGSSRAGRGTNSGTYSAAIRSWIFVGSREHRRRATGYLLPFSARTVHPISMNINMKNVGGGRA